MKKSFLINLSFILIGFLLVFRLFLSSQETFARLEINDNQQKEAEAKSEEKSNTKNEEIDLESLDKVELSEDANIQNTPGTPMNLSEVYTKDATEALKKQQNKQGTWEYIKSILPDIAIGLGVVILIESIIWIVRISRREKTQKTKRKKTKK